MFLLVNFVFNNLFENYIDGNDMEHLEGLMYLLAQLFFSSSDPFLRLHTRNLFTENSS